ncbi:glycosyltransferase family 87 protein [Symmachiella dynata]|uniref:glycosyltransferase family 87 protein n=1 Tax=Symmachiella dynata TaxID=2527995 RepID=UPI0030EB3A49
MDASPVQLRQRIILIAAIVIGGIVITVRSERSSSDLRGFHAVWVANWQQPSVENRPDPEDPYAPSFYMLFAPLGALPLWGAALVIYLINIGCAWGILRLTIGLLNLPPPDYAQLWIPVVGVAPFFLGTLSLGQNTLILMCLVLGAYAFARQGREFRGGCLIGLATAIKVYPVLFLVPFALRLRWKVCAGFLATIVFVAGGLGTLFLDYETNVGWYHSWGRFVSRADQDRLEDPAYPRSMRCTARYNNQAVHAVLARVMMDVPAKWYGDRFQVNLLKCDAATWRRARTGATLFFAGLGIAALCGLRLNRRRQLPRLLPVAETGGGISRDARELGMVCSWFFLTSPMVWTHYLVWAFFPLACVVRQRPHRPRMAMFVLGAWFAAECLIGSKFSRAIGVNLWAGLLLFGWFAVPALHALTMRFANYRRNLDDGPIPLSTRSGDKNKRRAA